jgi:hypothetical protein
MTPEGRVKMAIRELLTKYGDDVYAYMPVPTGYGRATLDYLGFVCGRGFAIEAKRPGGRPTIRQQQTIENVQKSGTKVFVVNSYESLQELDRWIATIVEEHHVCN